MNCINSRKGGNSYEQTVNDFNSINEESTLNWSFASQIKKFIKRFVSDPYKDEEREWMNIILTSYSRLRYKLQLMKYQYEQSKAFLFNE